MIVGTIWTIAGVMWTVGACWQWKDGQPGMAAMYVGIGALNIAVGVMYLAAA